MTTPDGLTISELTEEEELQGQRCQLHDLRAKVCPRPHFFSASAQTHSSAQTSR